MNLKSGLVLHRNQKPVIKGGTIALDGHPLILMGRQDSSISSRITSTNTDPAAPVLIVSSGAGNCSLWGDNSGLIGTVYVAAGGLTPSGNALTTFLSKGYLEKCACFECIKAIFQKGLGHM